MGSVIAFLVLVFGAFQSWQPDGEILTTATEPFSSPEFAGPTHTFSIQLTQASYVFWGFTILAGVALSLVVYSLTMLIRMSRNREGMMAHPDLDEVNVLLTRLHINRVSLLGVMKLAVLAVLIVALCGLLGKLWWVFNLLSNFRLQYIALLLLAGAFFLLVRHLRFSLLCGVAALTLFLPLAHYYLPQAAVAHLAPIKVVSFNVNWCNKNVAGIRDFLSSENADVVFLIEANPQLAEELQTLRSQYPYRLEYPRDDNRGLIVLSKHPLEEGRILSFNEVPYAEFAISAEGQKYHFTGIHTTSPMDHSRAFSRNQELFALAEAQQKNPRENAILMGDFNLSPFSRRYAEILKISGLQDSMAGFGLSSTWMRNTLVFAVPIDQLFLSSNLTVLQRTIGDDCGSDHNPLIVELAKKL